MRKQWLGVVVAIGLASAAAGGGMRVLAQSTSAAALPALRSFAGTWNLMFEDRRFATMILKEQDGRLTGSMTNGSVEMSSEGRITRAAAAAGTSPVVRTRLDGRVLHIVEKHGADEIEWAMNLTSDGRAELKMAGAAAPANAQAIRLERVWSEPPMQP